MTPQEVIRDLDASLSRTGQTIVLRKSNAVLPSVDTKGHVRGVRSDRVDGTTIRQSDKTVVISPTGLGDFGLPAAGGFVVVDDKPRAIIGDPELLKMADIVVRIEMIVKG